MTDWERCADCNAACGPSCGLHPTGCIFGGPPEERYWTARVGCLLPHPGDVPPFWTEREPRAIIAEALRELPDWYRGDPDSIFRAKS